MLCVGDLLLNQAGDVDHFRLRMGFNGKAHMGLERKVFRLKVIWKRVQFNPSTGQHEAPSWMIAFDPQPKD
jgi:hypothetical protein